MHQESWQKRRPNKCFTLRTSGYSLIGPFVWWKGHWLRRQTSCLIIAAETYKTRMGEIYLSKRTTWFWLDWRTWLIFLPSHFRDMQGGLNLSFNRQFYDEHWSKHRVVTCLDWSPQVPYNVSHCNHSLIVINFLKSIAQLPVCVCVCVYSTLNCW